MRRTTRRLLWISGGGWIVSWSIISLEIFRWHHMTTSLRLHPPPALPGFPPPRPGGLLLTTIVTSIAVFAAVSHQN